MKYKVFISRKRKLFTFLPESTHKNEAENSEQLEFMWNRKKRAVFRGGIDISVGPFKEQRSSCPIKTMPLFAYSMLIKISLNGFEKIRKPIFKTRLWGGVRRTRQTKILAALWCCHPIKMLIGEGFFFHLSQMTFLWSTHNGWLQVEQLC